MDEFDFIEFAFDFAVATTMICDHVDYNTAVEMVREEMRQEREESGRYTSVEK
jgi:hypothetical protein